MNDSKRLLLTLFVLSFCFSALTISCNNGGADMPSDPQSDSPKTPNTNDSSTAAVDSFAQELDTFAVGDINGDGRGDTAFLTGPQYSLQTMSCKDTCVTTIVFGDGIKPLLLGNSIGGTVYPIADMDGNGTEDIIFAPHWFTSCWSGFFVYSLRDTGWQLLASGSYYFCNNALLPPQRVRKLGNGNLEITNDSMTISDILPVRHQVALP